MIVDRDGDGATQLTFAALAERTSRFAQLLRDLGVRRRRPRAHPPAQLPRLPDGVPGRAEARRRAGAHVDDADRGRGPLPRHRLGRRRRSSPIGATWDAMHADAGRRCRRSATCSWSATARAAPARPAAGARARAVAGRRHALRSRRIRRAPRTRRTSSTPRARPAIRRASCTRTARCSAASRRRSTGSTSIPRGDRVLHAGKYNWTYVLGTGLMDPLYRGHTAIVHEGAHRRHAVAGAHRRATARRSSSACRRSTGRSSRRPRSAAPTCRRSATA